MDENIKTALARPFDRAQIKERIGPGGRQLSYVAIGDYVARLNEALDGEWSHEITDTRVLDDEVIVQVRLSAAGMIKMALGGAAITKRRDTGHPVSIAHDMMAAEAVALKRAARLLGVGAALYADDDDTSEPEANRAADGRSTARISSAQLGKLRGLVADSGGDWGAYRASIRERHGVNVEFCDLRLASKLIDELIGQSAPRPSNGRNGNGHSGNGSGNGNGNGAGWRRP